MNRSPLKNTLRLPGLLGLITLLVLLMGFTSCGKEKPAPKVTPGSAQVMAEPIFQKEGELEFVTASGATSKIDIEIADTPDQRSMGLMHRKQMDPDRGMLFIFGRMEEQAFWMKNTLIPLDIIYVDDQMRIISIAENAKPLDETDIESGGPAQYVVEVNGGYCRQKGITTGDQIRYKAAI